MRNHIKTLSLDEIIEMTPAELIAGLERGALSLYKLFRADRARLIQRVIEDPRTAPRRIVSYIVWTLGHAAMKYVVGPLCRFILWCVFLGDKGSGDEAYWRMKRAKLVRVVRFLFPDQVRGEPPAQTPAQTSGEDGRGLIVGFNHPTLHEVFGLISWSLNRFPDRINNFPTNLPWYESICTCAPLMKKVGVHITPLITQSSFKKLERIHWGDEKMIGYIQKVREMLLIHYFNIAISYERSGDNTFSAPSAMRQVTIFPKSAASYSDPDAERLLPAMSGLMYKIIRANKDRKPTALFLPVTVVPPKLRVRRLRGLKLFRRFSLIVGKGFSMDEARTLGRGFDYAFLMRLTENAPEELWYPKAAPHLLPHR